MTVDWNNDLCLSPNDLYLDARQPREHSFVSHAHSDHLAAHHRAVLTVETLRLTRGRVTFGFATELRYRTRQNLSNDLSVTAVPAGHILGSAMLILDDSTSQVLYTGDFKLRPCRTCPPAELVRADQLIMECTYGLPQFRFPDRAVTEMRLIELMSEAVKNGEQPIVFAYAMGKAQEATRILTEAGFVVTAHGAVANVSDAYRELGMDVGPYRQYHRDDFHGPKALDLRERGVLIAPPANARTSFTTAFERRRTVMLSGWGVDPSARYRYGVDEVVPMSDHADFDELLETVERVAPSRVYLLHGFVREFAETLRSRGVDARPVKPDAQLELF